MPEPHQCHPLLGKSVVVMDVKRRSAMDCIGRTGVIRHDRTFGHDYLAFDDGGSLDPDVGIFDELVDRDARPTKAGVSDA